MNRYFKLNNKIKMKEQYFVRIAASLVLLSVFTWQTDRRTIVRPGRSVELLKNGLKE